MRSTQKIPLLDADVQFVAQFFDDARATELLRELIASTPWETHFVNIFGRNIPAPRQSSWHGEPYCSYRYSKVRYEPKLWTPCLSFVREALARAGIGEFNCVLANFYRSGADSMGWHSDDEPELGANPLIASVSLGAPRRFCLRHKASSEKTELILSSGSLLVMAGTTQKKYQHALPKMATVGMPRVNLTFRQIAPSQITQPDSN
jgi:alkylated DNA repair dioxygenase AlkB